MESKFSGRFFNSDRWSRRYSGSRTVSQQRKRARTPTGRLIKKIQRQEYWSVIQPKRVGPMTGAKQPGDAGPACLSSLFDAFFRRQEPPLLGA